MQHPYDPNNIQQRSLGSAPRAGKQRPRHNSCKEDPLHNRRKHHISTTHLHRNQYTAAHLAANLPLPRRYDPETNPCPGGGPHPTGPVCPHGLTFADTFNRNQTTHSSQRAMTAPGDKDIPVDQPQYQTQPNGPRPPSAERPPQKGRPPRSTYFQAATGADCRRIWTKAFPGMTMVEHDWITTGEIPPSIHRELFPDFTTPQQPPQPESSAGEAVTNQQGEEATDTAQPSDQAPVECACYANTNGGAPVGGTRTTNTTSSSAPAHSCGHSTGARKTLHTCLVFAVLFRLLSSRVPEHNPGTQIVGQGSTERR